MNQGRIEDVDAHIILVQQLPTSVAHAAPGPVSCVAQALMPPSTRIPEPVI